MRTIRPLAALAVVALSVTGCTISSDEDQPAEAGSGSIKPVASIAGKQVRVGSKEFDEQLLLGQLAILVLEAAGAKPVDKTNITGSDTVRKALTGNSIDLYWEYTGTGWANYLKKTQKVPDPAKLYAAVKAADAPNGVVWWARSPANDTYALVANGAAAKSTGVKSISDYAALVKKNPAQAKTCLGPEFKSRDDGFSGVEKTYGFKLPAAHTKVLADAVVYPTVGKGDTCDFGSVASTDGRIPAQKLVLLTDDKKVFPIYNPAINIRAALAAQNPGLEQAFAPVAAKLDSKTLTDLNKKVSVDGEDPKTVARDWLKAGGFIA